VRRRRSIVKALSLPLFALLLPTTLLSLGCGGDASNVIPVVAVAGSSEPPSILAPPPATAIAASTKSAPTAIAWLASEVDARRRAKARRVPLVVFLFATWAVPAVRMDRDTWTDPRILARSPGFVALRLDVSEADANAQAEADHFDLKTMPSTILLDDGGREIARLEGFADADAVLAALDRFEPPGD
jgi:thiol:disulfide interchange protein DsbD